MGTNATSRTSSERACAKRQNHRYGSLSFPSSPIVSCNANLNMVLGFPSFFPSMAVGKHMTYGFVEFRGEEDAEYAMKVLNMIKLAGKPIKVNRVAQDKKLNEVGANLFIGNLDPDVDEKLLYDTFSAFGGITQTPKIMRDPDLGTSKGFGFISFDAFEASDMAIECMNGQFLCNRPIVVQYAFKKDTPGERHGSQAERMLAATAAPANRFKPNTNFSGGAGDIVVMPNVPSGAPQSHTMYDPLAPGMYGDMNGMMLQAGAGAPLAMPGGMSMPPPPPPPMVHSGGYDPNTYMQPGYGMVAPPGGGHMMDTSQTPTMGVHGSIPPPPPPPMAQGMPPPPARGMDAVKPAWYAVFQNVFHRVFFTDKMSFPPLTSLLG